MSKNNNFAVVDIGTNSVKCVCFSGGKTIDIDQCEELRNKNLTQAADENLDPQELLKYIKEYIAVAKKQGIDADKVYIVATEAFRRSSNKDEIIELIKKETGRKIHIISSKREAYLSALGGLSYIRKNFKGKPNKILYIEAGGGSTEVSLFDTSKRSFLAMKETFSIPFGSKDDIKDEELAKYNIYFNKMLAKISKDDNIAVVVNSSAVARILARQHDKEKYLPASVARDQLSMSVGDFGKKLDDIMSMDLEEIRKKFYLGKGDPEGFINHCKILQYIMKQSSKVAKKASLSTTIGGLKHGLKKEIERAKGDEKKIAQVLEKDNMKVGEEPPVEINEDKNDKTWRIRVKKAIADVNANAEGKFYFEEEPSREKDKLLTFVDQNNKENKIQFASMNNASVCGDIQAYYAICMTAKKLGKKINFGNFKTLEQKALLYQACLENGVDIANSPKPDEFKECKNFARIKKLTAKQEGNPSIVVKEKIKN